jgi:hypothetical protein
MSPKLTNTIVVMVAFQIEHSVHFPKRGAVAGEVTWDEVSFINLDVVDVCMCGVQSSLSRLSF